MPSSKNGFTISFERVCKRFGEQVILDNFTAEIAMGEKVAIIGPSGSGKTTILRLLMSLETIDSGCIRIGGEVYGISRDESGRVVEDNRKLMKALRSRMGMVFQSFNLFPHMTVEANVMESPVRSMKLQKSDARELSHQLLEKVGLAEKAKALPGSLSGGQQQRVAIARALALSPSIMLFDEVTSALDPELVGEVLNLITELAEESGMTMLIVTHEMGFARQIADRVLFLEHGLIVEQGPPEQIFRSPREERTARFLRAVGAH